MLNVVVLLAGLVLALCVVKGLPLRRAGLLLIETLLWLRRRETFSHRSARLSAVSTKFTLPARSALF